MDDKTKEKLAASLTGDDVSILPHLPYLLQDLWELGGVPGDAVELLRKPAAEKHPQPLRVLDLCCGKGAVSIAVAKELGAEVCGVDLISEFIQEAKRKAEENGVANQCEFIVANANAFAQGAQGYDAVIFAATGDVLGDRAIMLQKLAGVVVPGGYIVLDEGYCEADAQMEWTFEYATMAQWQVLFAAAGLTLVGDLVQDAGRAKDRNESDMQAIERRVNELCGLHPEKSALFQSYLAAQRAEVVDVEQNIVGEGWLLQKQ